tara:strand:+ start:804 stop:1397 length:594 start_codon:yes stop_codon:yes gene_type:complete
MIRIGILGDIGSGKSFIAKNFGFPVFNADQEVNKLYTQNRKVFFKLRKKLPNYFTHYPIKKDQVIKAILSNKGNLKEILKIIHPEVKNKMNFFIKKNKSKNFIVLDIPLLLENKINKKKDILIFVESNKKEIFKRLRKRERFNLKLYKNFKRIQLSLDFKKKKSHFIIKNNFLKKSVKIQIKKILKKIKNEGNNFRY